MTIELKLLTTQDVEDLYPRLRIEDQEECIVLGSNPREALLMGAFDNVFSVSRGRAYALIDFPDRKCVNAHDRCYEGGECPLCEFVSEPKIIGAIGFTSSGFLWALSCKFSLKQLRELWRRTPEITNRLIFEAKCKGVFIDMPAYFHNIVHSRNKTAMRWLKKCGLYQVSTEYPVDVGGEVFYPFRSLLPEEMKPVCAPLSY